MNNGRSIHIRKSKLSYDRYILNDNRIEIYQDQIKIGSVKVSNNECGFGSNYFTLKLNEIGEIGFWDFNINLET